MAPDLPAATRRCDCMPIRHTIPNILSLLTWFDRCASGIPLYWDKRPKLGAVGMSDGGDIYRVLLDRLADPTIRGRIRRALGMDLVLDTWLNGEREESFSPEAEERIGEAVEGLAREAVASRAVFPDRPMREGYVRAVFQELLSSTALYQAQKFKGARDVEEPEAEAAVGILRRFIAGERDGLTAAGGLYFVISAHEDLSAIRYYRRMHREDFLMGTLHRPWSQTRLTDQLDLYLRAGLVKEAFTGEGEMLELTVRGEEMLGLLRELLEESGEFGWRANAQRWVIFGETDYDRVHRAIFPDIARTTRGFIESLEIPPGARVLEIGAGTGRATCDLGLARRVAEAGGTLVALEPSAALIPELRRKCQEQDLVQVQIVQGTAESLPFPDHTFDLITSIAVLHFTEVEQAVAEMVRVTRPGGRVTAMTPLQGSPFAIPMVAAWFRPLQVLAQELGLSLGERQGVAAGRIEAALRRTGVEAIRTELTSDRVVATDYRAFLDFVLRGGAFFQNILSRLPFQERWRIIHLLEESGERLVATTTPEEQEFIATLERVVGQVPAAGGMGSPSGIPVPTGPG